MNFKTHININNLVCVGFSVEVEIGYVEVMPRSDVFYIQIVIFT